MQILLLWRGAARHTEMAENTLHAIDSQKASE